MDERERLRLQKPDLISGSEILLRTLLLEGVECVFGYPGGSVLYIYDAMHGNDRFRHILTRHEQGAIHAADGYARATGRTGVCIATSGPGAANLLTGIATAMMDSIPLVVVTGSVATDLIGSDAFQEADIVGMSLPITKHSACVRRVEELASAIREAFHIANHGRKGPVLVDIPKDVSAAMIEFRYPAEAVVPGCKPVPDPDPADVDRLAEAIRRAKRPLLLAGAGVIYAEAESELAALARTWRIPVTTTLMGLGGFPADDPLWIGMPGMHGTVAANRALQQCDLLISVGSRFDDRVTMRLSGFAPQASVAHVDIDAAEIGKLVPAGIAVVGDAKKSLAALNGLLARRPGRIDAEARMSEWLTALDHLRQAYPLKIPTSKEGRLQPQAVIRLIAERARGDTIVTTDVGQHQMWTAQFFPFSRPRSLITSGGLGTMGFGLPSAIGAQVGRPDATVVSINGDGGMQMCAQELAVCSAHNLPVKIAVINNGKLGMIKQWQEIVHGGRHSHIELGGWPDFVMLADAYGIKGLRARTLQEARQAWEEAVTTPGPVLVDFAVDPDALVYPMVPQGMGLDDMLTGEE